MFYLATHSTHFIYGYMVSDIWLWTILIVRKETHCRHIGYSYRLTARVLLYAPSHRQDNTYHGLCYTSHGALAGTRNSSMGPPHEASIQRTHRTMSERSTSELHLAPCSVLKHSTNVLKSPLRLPSWWFCFSWSGHLVTAGSPAAPVSRQTRHPAVGGVNPSRWPTMRCHINSDKCKKKL